MCRHIREVTAEITAVAPALRAAGQKACVIIATDGKASDGDLAAALRPLRDLPCFVVVRLCTDQDYVVKYVFILIYLSDNLIYLLSRSYWNNIDHTTLSCRWTYWTISLTRYKL